MVSDFTARSCAGSPVFRFMKAGGTTPGRRDRLVRRRLRRRLTVYDHLIRLGLRFPLPAAVLSAISSAIRVLAVERIVEGDGDVLEALLPLGLGEQRV